MKKVLTVTMDGIRYHASRPADCRHCFFWKNRKKGCVLGKENCYYLIEPPKGPSKCEGCPYKRAKPCVLVPCYRSQSRYRTAADREIEAQTISIPEMAKLLGIPREKVYWILDCKKYRDCFVIERVADRRRITKTSFEIWLNSQSTYRLQEQVMEAHEEPPLELKCPIKQRSPSLKTVRSMPTRQQHLPNCWLTPLWPNSSKILQRTYKPLYINSDSFPIGKLPLFYFSVSCTSAPDMIHFYRKEWSS